LTNSKGDWMVYDAIQLFARSGKIDSLSAKSVKGWLRDKTENATRQEKSDSSENQEAALKKFVVGYNGNILTRPANLTAEIFVDGKQVGRLEKQLNPASDSQGTEIQVPMNVTDQPIELRLALHYVNFGNNQTDTKETGIISSTVMIPAERKWELHIIHQTHLDIGYTHIQQDVLDLQVQSIKDALKYIEETKDYPEEAKFKFHPEGMWAVEEFMRTASEDEKEAFIKAARNRDIHLDAMYAQAMTGMYSDEELFELLGAAIRFGRKYDIPIDTAMQTDVPGYVWGLVPTLAKSGVKYMNMAPNPGHRVGRVFEWGDKPFYWVSPSGKEKIMCWIISTSYNMFHFQPIGYEIPEERFFGILADFENKDFPYDIATFRYCIEKDNGRPNRVISDQVKDWNEKYVYPKLILSRNSDLMRKFEEKYGDKIPVLSGDYTPYWEDGAASTSEATSKNRTAKGVLKAAELFWAINAPEKFPENIGKFDDAWTNIIMYDEHTWGAHNSISEPDSDFVKQQDDYKQAYASKGFAGAKELFEYFIAPDVDEEAVSYYLNIETDTPTADAEMGTLTNGLITVKVDTKTGAIISLKRKGSDHEFVNPGDDGNAGLDDYLCIIGRKADENRSRIEDEVKITVANTEDNDETWAGLVIESTAPNCDKLTRTIGLMKNSDIVSVKNIMDKKMERRPEGIFFGFPFNVPGGKWRVDTPWAVVEVEKDQLPGANRNFYCVQNFCNLSNDELGIDFATPSAPMVQFAPIKLTAAANIKDWREHIDPNGTIYSWVCNNHWETNYKAGQEGKLDFRYGIRPYIGKYDAAKSQKIERNISILDISANLIKLDNDNVLVTRLKPCREYLPKEPEVERSATSGQPEPLYGPGLFVRLYNPTDEPQTVNLEFLKKGEKVDPTIYISNPWEDRLEKVSDKKITIEPKDMTAIRVE
ncbi:MAG: hypothetical protein ACRC2T_13350, partial [Thermoguttaceae bacterium]